MIKRRICDPASRLYLTREVIKLDLYIVATNTHKNPMPEQGRLKP
jgi:hypothetical protein